MDVMKFCLTCSPCCAQYVKNTNADHYQKKFPKAALAIKENHYVDVYLDSLDTEEEAIRLALEIKFVNSKAGFHIRNWMSYTNVVMQP